MIKTVSIAFSTVLVWVLVGLSFMPACAAPASTKPVEINILTTGVGTAGYIFGFAWSDMVNKDFNELKLTALESKSMEINLQTYIGRPETRKNHIYLAGSIEWPRARDGKMPFTKATPGLRLLLCHLPVGSLAFFSYNSKITKPSDLKGKTIAGMPAGSLEWLASGFLNYWGMTDQVRFMKVGMSKAYDAVIDGTADVAALPVCDMYEPKKWAITPGAYQALAKQSKVYFVNIPKSDIEGLAAKSGDFIPPLWIAKDELRGSFPAPQEDMWLPTWFVGFWVDEQFDEEIAYKVVKSAITHASEFESIAKYWKWFKNNIAKPNIGETNWHPGALRAFKEAGLKIGESTP